MAFFFDATVYPLKRSWFQHLFVFQHNQVFTASPASSKLPIIRHREIAAPEVTNSRIIKPVYHFARSVANIIVGHNNLVIIEYLI
jgi:hypothetical protein